MAANIDVTALTLNPKEAEEFQSFVFERVYERIALNQVHVVWTGVKMQEQIVFASLLSKMGIKDTSCVRPNSGAKSTLTQKYWIPQNVGDTLVNCQVDLNSLFKAYYSKIQSYRDLFDIDGSDEMIFLALLIEEAIIDSIWRLSWFGDTAVAAATAGAAGLISAADVKYYDVIDGIWKEIFAEVAATTLNRYTIAENALTTPAAQLTLAAGRSVEIFEAVWANADSRLKAEPNRQLEVTNEVFENYRQYLQSKGENFSIEYTENGFNSLKWNGMPVVNMENSWDRFLQADFVDNTTNNAYYLPNRVLLTVPANTPIATLNDNDFTELESWYEKKERQNYTAFGYTLDAKLLEGYMASVAY